MSRGLFLNEFDFDQGPPQRVWVSLVVKYPCDNAPIGVVNRLFFHVGWPSVLDRGT